MFFYSKIYQNNFLYFFKIIFDTSILKRLKNIKKIQILPDFCLGHRTERDLFEKDPPTQI
jgi:hypothetical protein